ncbi:MAG: right-handed parallel beta-helix repeat-containing protein [Promethearchaeota archaeon]
MNRKEIYCLVLFSGIIAVVCMGFFYMGFKDTDRDHVDQVGTLDAFGVDESASYSNFTFIHINGNWSAAASQEWCSGNGSSGNPYVLENLMINASSTPIGAGILIENTGFDYFVIRNCTVFGLNGSASNLTTAFKFLNARNGYIIGNNVVNNSNYTLGLTFDQCFSMYVSGNVVNGTYIGVSTYHSDDDFFQNNTVTNSVNSGMLFALSNNITVFSNNVSFSGLNGIHLDLGTSMVNISDNIIYQSGNSGFFSNNSCLYLVIINNTIWNSSGDGMAFIGNNTFNYVAYNTLFSNGLHSIFSDNTSSIIRNLNNCSGSYDSWIVDENEQFFDWATTKSWVSWLSGSGTKADPYEVNGLNFNGQDGNFTGVILNNSRAHVIIENSTFKNYRWGGGEVLSAFYTLNSSNINFTGNALMDNDLSIFNSLSFNISILRNVFSMDAYGIYMNVSDNILVFNNTFSSGLYSATGFSRCTNISLVMNDISGYNDSAVVFIGNGTSANNIASGNQILNSSIGIYVRDDENMTIIGNQIANNTGSGINVSIGLHVLIQENDIVDNALFGVFTRGMNGSFINNNVSGNGLSGFYLERANSTLIRLNNINGNGLDGITIFDSGDEFIIGNIIKNNTRVGIYAENNTIVNKMVIGNILDGNVLGSILADGTSNIAYIGNLIDGMLYGDGSDDLVFQEHTDISGIGVPDAAYYMPYWCRGLGTLGDPMYIENVSIHGDLFYNNLDGYDGISYYIGIQNVSISGQLVIDTSDNVTAINNTVGTQIFLRDCRNIIVDSNIANTIITNYFPWNLTIINNMVAYGISIGSGASNFIVSNNKVHSGGIVIVGPTISTPAIIGNISNNEINGSGTGVKGTFSYVANHSVIISGNHIHDVSEHGIMLNWANGFVVINNTITNCSWDGIWINDSDALLINDNLIENCSLDGIWIENSRDNVLNGNMLRFMSGSGILLMNAVNHSINDNVILFGNQSGIVMSNASINNTIQHNDIIDNAGSGISLLNSSDWNLITGNNVSGNGVGLNVSGGSSFNTMNNNSLLNSAQYGVIFMNKTSECTNNLFYLNNVSNPASINVFNNCTNNSWDNGSLGNYWGDYLIRYPNASRYGLVWLTPYEISSGEFDNYPLCGDFLPDATFTTNATRVYLREVISFTFVGNEGNYPTTHYWNFSDGTTLNGVNVVHAFALSGVYNVSLELEDNDGDLDRSWVLITVIDPSGDDDGDGLTNEQEIEVYNTDYLNSDTDGDGLTDGDEVNTWHSNPNIVDTDSDGLADGDEVNTWTTDPTNPDTDGDGVSDGDEVKNGTNPLAPPPDFFAIIIVSISVVGGIILLFILDRKGIISFKKIFNKFTNKRAFPGKRTQ